MKEWLKSLIGPVIFLAVVAGALYLLIQNIQPEEDERQIPLKSFVSEDEKYTLENDYLLFEMDALTTQFKITVKETGEVWLSNPEEGGSDPLALTVDKGKNQSTLVLTYSNKTGIDNALNNYDYSISRGIYEVTADANSIRVDYSIGDVQKKFIVPPVITKDNMDAVIANMAKDDGQFIQNYYKKYDIKKLTKKDNKEELLERYPEMANQVLYVLRDTTTDALRAKFQGIFEAAGYTEEDYARDCALDTGTIVSDKPVFLASMIYTLEGHDLKVEVPMDSLDSKTDYPIYELAILPMFGCGSKSDDGYMFVPEGSGAIINMNNGKLIQNSYYSNVYGFDRAIDRDYVIQETKINNPLFGAAIGENSFLCFLEDGAPYASIFADISGKKNSYNTIYSIYRIKARDEYNVADRVGGKMYVYNDNLNLDESIVQRYRFYNTNSYVELAKGYRDYLFETYPNLFTKKTDSSVPVAVEILGAVDKVKQVCGVPVSRPLELTTYEEAKGIIEDLSTSGIDNMSVKLTGWANDGVRQTILNKISLVSDLGSKKSFNELCSYAANNNIPLYLNGIVNVAIDSNILDGFNSFDDAARFITKERAEIYPYNVVNYIKRESTDPSYLLNPENISNMVDNLSNYASEHNTGVSFEDFANDLPSDFRRTNTISRDTVRKMQIEKLAALKANGTKVMVNGGFDYALPYADLVTNYNLEGHSYTIIDYEIPFVELALHGYVNYTGEALNLTENKENELLKSVEYGAGLMFHVMDESSFTLQKTLYSQFFGSEYDVVKKEIIDTYNKYNSDFGHIYSQEMSNHELITSTLTLTTYEDGTKVYVNYGYEAVTTPEGTVIAARDYKVMR